MVLSSRLGCRSAVRPVRPFVPAHLYGVGFCRRSRRIIIQRILRQPFPLMAMARGAVPCILSFNDAQTRVPIDMRFDPILWTCTITDVVVSLRSDKPKMDMDLPW